MSFTPEPDHPINEHTNAQLNREFAAIFQDFEQTKDFIIGAMPIKAFYVILDGVGGAINGVVNTTLPALFPGSYNIDREINAGAGVIRTGEGVYVFTLRFAQIGSVDILPIMFPAFQINIGAANHLDPIAESVRILLTDVDIPSGTIELSVQQLEVPPSGKGDWMPYDLRFVAGGFADRIWASADVSLTGNAGDYGQTP